MLLIAATIFITYLGLFLLYRGSSSMSIAMGTMGVFLCSTQVIASCFDFGWYIPANTLLLAVLVGVVSQHGHAFAGRLRKNHLFRLQPPIWITNLVCLAAFGLCLLTSFSLFRQAETEDRLLPARQVWDYANMPLDVTEERIELLSSTLATSNHSTQLNELGRLWIHRSRLLFWESMLKLLPSDVGKPENQEKINNQFWSIATLGRMEEQMGDFRMRLGNSFANEFQREEFMANSLLPAVDAFYASLKLRPVQPEIQIQLGQILCLVGDRELAQQTIERAVASAPNNVNIRITASLSNLFLGDLEQAIPHLRRTLELDPAQFVKAISLIQGLTGRISVPVSDKVIADRIIPENPQLVYDYAIKFVPESSPLRSDLLGKADSMLKSVSLSDYKNVLLKANILLAKGDTEQGIEQLEMAVVSNPSDQATQYRLAKLQFENGKLDKALRHAKRLNQMNETNKNYEQLLLEVQKAIDTERLFNRE
jgi:tetratricopeptide (TPR) repeat protein